MTTLTEAPPEATPNERRQARARSDRATIYLLLFPALVPVVVLSVVPLLRGMYLGFTDARAGRNVDTSFTGVENYQELLNDDLFWDAFRIGLVWAFTVTILQFLLGIGLALLLNQPLRFRGSPACWRWCRGRCHRSSSASCGGSSTTPTPGWSTSCSTARARRTCNTTGSATSPPHCPPSSSSASGPACRRPPSCCSPGCRACSASCTRPPRSTARATWQRFRNVTMPALMPVVVAITTLDFIWNFNSFGLVYVLTAGGPGGKTMLPMLFAYEEAFRYGNFGYAAALGNVMVLIIVAFLAVYLRRRLREANA